MCFYSRYHSAYGGFDMFFTNKMSDEEAKRKALEEMRWLYDEPNNLKKKNKKSHIHHPNNITSNLTEP